LFGLPARSRLLSEFRTVATTRFETRAHRRWFQHFRRLLLGASLARPRRCDRATTGG
jgi:hypothetical protein